MSYIDVNTIALQKDGNILLGGQSVTLFSPYFLHLTLVRYNGDGSRRQIVISRILRWLNHHGITWQPDAGVQSYEVQRSTDGGITYRQVARIENNRSSALTYEEPGGNGNELYRVAATGREGATAYSNSILINAESSVTMFPNPARSQLQVQGLPGKGAARLTIVDLSGTVRATVTAAGSSSYPVNTAGLKPGSYLLKIEHRNTITTHLFVKE